MISVLAHATMFLQIFQGIVGKSRGNCSSEDNAPRFAFISMQDLARGVIVVKLKLG